MSIAGSLFDCFRPHPDRAASLCLMAAGVTLVAGSDEPRPAQRLWAEPRPLVIGHRGYPVIAPENTLPSFRLALTAGVDLVELDYHHSSDGVPIVLHDADLDRTTDAPERWQARKVRAETRTARDLQTLDAGRWFAPGYAGTRLPLLTEALEVIQAQGVTLIERKGGDAITCVQLLQRLDLINRVVVQSFDWAYLRDFHAAEPRQLLGALGPPGSARGRKLTDAEKTLNAAWIEQVEATGARLVVWSQLVTREAVDWAHGRGLKVWVYTINEPPLANALLDLGIDGIITDNPALIWRTLALRAPRREAK